MGPCTPISAVAPSGRCARRCSEPTFSSRTCESYRGSSRGTSDLARGMRRSVRSRRVFPASAPYASVPPPSSFKSPPAPRIPRHEPPGHERGCVRVAADRDAERVGEAARRVDRHDERAPPRPRERDGERGEAENTREDADHLAAKTARLLPFARRRPGGGMLTPAGTGADMATFSTVGAGSARTKVDDPPPSSSMPSVAPSLAVK